MSVNLMQAHNNWKDRPEDQRFQNLQAMFQATNQYKLEAAESTAQLSNLRVAAAGEDLRLIGKNDRQAELTHWSMGQLAARAKAPASYLRALPATLAAQNLNHGLKALADDSEESGPAKLLFRMQGDKLQLRAAVTDKYKRIWNSDIVARLIQLQERNPNWKNPMAYAVGGKFGGAMVPSGLYASDHDMFAFLVDESRAIAGSPEGLKRGFFVWNSEVGATSFGIMAFIYDYVCGNNIVWGARNIAELKIRHVGQADTRVFQQIGNELRKYSESSANELEARIRKAKAYELGTDRKSIMENLTAMTGKLKLVDLTTERLKEGLDVADRRTERYGNPNTLWAAVSGITEASQASKHTDTRVKIDRAAGKLLNVIEF